VFYGNVLLNLQIGYHPCYHKDTVMLPGTPLLLHRPFQQQFRIRRQLTVGPYLLRIHPRIGKYLPQSRLR
jgi:hypothetical protein